MQMKKQESRHYTLLCMKVLDGIIGSKIPYPQIHPAKQTTLPFYDCRPIPLINYRLAPA
jgi:hypothetical protein